MYRPILVENEQQLLGAPESENGNETSEERMEYNIGFDDSKDRLVIERLVPLLLRSNFNLNPQISEIWTKALTNCPSPSSSIDDIVND